MNTQGPQNTTTEPSNRSNTVWIVAAAIVILCCCCFGSIGLIFAFFEDIASALQGVF